VTKIKKSVKNVFYIYGSSPHYLGGHGPMASGKHEPISGVWGRAPSGMQGQSSWSGGQGAKPPETEALLVFGCSMKATNLRTFLKFGNAKNQIFVLSLQKIMGGHETGVCVSPGPGLKPPLPARQCN